MQARPDPQAGEPERRPFAPLASPGGASLGDTPVPNSEARPGSTVILLVDDESEVRTVTAELLRSDGYTVVEASGTTEALALTSDLTTRIDLVIADVVMPDGDGRRLVHLLREQRPCLRALFISGHDRDTVVEDGMMPATAAFLQKPFTLTTLERQVRAVLEAAEATPRC